MLPLCIAFSGGMLIFLVLIPLYIGSKLNSLIRPVLAAIKGIASLTAISFGVAGIIKMVYYSNNGDALPSLTNEMWLLAGLILCAAGDITLIFSITAGGSLFFLAHVSYLVFFLRAGNFSPISILIFTLTAAMVMCSLYQYIGSVGKNKLRLIMYGIVVLACCLLAVSDYMLFRNTYVEDTVLTDCIALNTYYTGIFLMALSLYLKAFLVL